MLDLFGVGGQNQCPYQVCLRYKYKASSRVESWMMLWQVLSLGGRSPSWRFPTLGNGGHERLRVRVLKKHFYRNDVLLWGWHISVLVISGGASLCTILHRRRRRTFCGSFLDPSGQSRTSRWDIHLYPYPNSFERTFTWFWFNFELRWSETCRRTSARALASSPWPTTRRLLSPFRWGKNLILHFLSVFANLPQFFLYRVILLDI